MISSLPFTEKNLLAHPTTAGCGVSLRLVAIKHQFGASQMKYLGLEPTAYNRLVIRVFHSTRALGLSALSRLRVFLAFLGPFQAVLHIAVIPIDLEGGFNFLARRA
jgi:hypothetical protein